MHVSSFESCTSTEGEGLGLKRNRRASQGVCACAHRLGASAAAGNAAQQAGRTLQRRRCRADLRARRRTERAAARASTLPRRASPFFSHQRERSQKERHICKRDIPSYSPHTKLRTQLTRQHREKRASSQHQLGRVSVSHGRAQAARDSPWADDRAAKSSGGEHLNIWARGFVGSLGHGR